MLDNITLPQDVNGVEPVELLAVLMITCSQLDRLLLSLKPVTSSSCRFVNVLKPVAQVAGTGAVKPRTMSICKVCNLEKTVGPPHAAGSVVPGGKVMLYKNKLVKALSLVQLSGIPPVTTGASLSFAMISAGNMSCHTCLPACFQTPL